MEILINGSEKAILNPCKFTYTEYLTLIDRVDKYVACDIDPKSIISFGLESVNDILAREKALNLIVSVAFKKGLIPFRNDNSKFSLFVEPFNFDIYSYSSDDKVKITIIKEDGREIDISIAIDNLSRYLDMGAELLSQGSNLSDFLDDEATSSLSFFIACKNAPLNIGKLISGENLTIHCASNSAFFMTSFVNECKVMH